MDAKKWVIQCPTCGDISRETENMYTESQLDEESIMVMDGKIQLLCNDCTVIYIRNDKEIKGTLVDY